MKQRTSKSWDRLTERRADDRLIMARALRDLTREVAPMRVSCKILMDDGYNEKRVSVLISGSGGLTVRVTFAGDSPQTVPNTFVLSWHIDEPRNGFTIDPKFAQDINTFHFRKATDVFYGFAVMMEMMRTRLEWMEDGRAVK